MSLATEQEWETDPELKAMRAEFVASFEERRTRLARAAEGIGAGREASLRAEALKEALYVAHKLAGAAETYGFPTLTRICLALEDWLGSAVAGGAAFDCGSLTEHAALLVEALAAAQAGGKDVPAFAADPRMARLQAAAQAARVG